MNCVGNSQRHEEYKMKDLDDFGRSETGLEVMYWPMGKSERQLLTLDQELATAQQQVPRQGDSDDDALAGLRESDPEAYRMVVYSWA